jgi:hypothetical protein
MKNLPASVETCLFSIMFVMSEISNLSALKSLDKSSVVCTLRLLSKHPFVILFYERFQTDNLIIKEIPQSISFRIPKKSIKD